MLGCLEPLLYCDLIKGCASLYLQNCDGCVCTYIHIYVYMYVIGVYTDAVCCTVNFNFMRS